MKKLALIVCLLVVSTVSQACVFVDPWPPRYQSVARFGPVQLKVDDEWIITKGDVKFVRIGLRKDINTEQLADYKNISPQDVSLTSSTTKFYTTEITYYDIPIESNEVWIDLYIGVVNTYTKGDHRIVTSSFFGKDFFIYHPKRNKWWGIKRTTVILELLMNEELYNEKFNSVDDFKNYLDERDKQIDFDPDYNVKILNNRVLKIPSTTVYEENLKSALVNYSMFQWFEEKVIDNTETVDE